MLAFTSATAGGIQVEKLVCPSPNRQCTSVYGILRLAVISLGSCESRIVFNLLYTDDCQQFTAKKIYITSETIYSILCHAYRTTL